MKHSVFAVLLAAVICGCEKEPQCVPPDATYYYTFSGSPGQYFAGDTISVLPVYSDDEFRWTSNGTGIFTVNGLTDCGGITDPKMVLVPGVNYLQLTRTNDCGASDDHLLVFHPDTHYTGSWFPKAEMSVARNEPAAFTIGTKGYVCGGRSPTYAYLNDLWEWDQQADTWTQKANLPAGRANAIGFACNGKGYVGLGYGNSVVYSDIWEWDPTTNQWTQKNNFPGGTRTGAFACELSSFIYIGCGDAGNNALCNDFWKYEPATDAWTNCAPFSGTAREDAGAFVVNNKVFVCGGCTSPTAAFNDLWEYDPAADQWSQKAPMPRNNWNSATFVLNNEGYVACPREDYYQTHFYHSRYVYRYDPVTDSWSKVHVLSGQPRSGSAGFSIGPNGYIIGGCTDYSYSSELWEFTP